MTLFIDPTCEHCADMLVQAREHGNPLRVCYMVPAHGATFSEAAIQVAVRESCPEAFIAFVVLRHRDLAWFTGWRSWEKTAELLHLDADKIEAALPQAMAILMKEVGLAKALKVPAAPAVWDGKILIAGAGCLDEYLRRYGQREVASNT